MVDQWDVEHFTNLAMNGYLGRPDGTLMAFFPGLPALLRRSGWSSGCPIYADRGDHLRGLLLRWRPRPWLGWAARSPRWPGCSPPPPCSRSCPTPRRCSARPPSGPGSGPGPTSGRRPPGWPRSPAPYGCRGCSWWAPSPSWRSPATRARRGTWRERGRRLVWLLIPAAVLGVFVLYLYSLTGSWTAWYHAQSTGWARGHDTAVGRVLEHRRRHPRQPGPPAVAAGLPRARSSRWGRGARRRLVPRSGRLWAEASWVAIQVLAFSISYWFMSVNRAILLWFPLWMMIAQLVTWRPERGRRALGPPTSWSGWPSRRPTLAMLAWSWLYFTGQLGQLTCVRVGRCRQTRPVGGCGSIWKAWPTCVTSAACRRPTAGRSPRDGCCGRTTCRP